MFTIGLITYFCFTTNPSKEKKMKERNKKWEQIRAKKRKALILQFSGCGNILLVIVLRARGPCPPAESGQYVDNHLQLLALHGSGVSTVPETVFKLIKHTSTPSWEVLVIFFFLPSFFSATNTYFYYNRMEFHDEQYIINNDRTTLFWNYFAIFCF